MKYAIEHFGKLFKWYYIEYAHISKIVGKKNLIFTNVKGKRDKRNGISFHLSVR